MSKNEMLDLREIQNKYSNCNLLLPQTVDTQINPLYKMTVKLVPVDTSEASGDIFKVGVTKINNRSVEVYSLSKPLLNKMAQAAGVQFDPQYTCGSQIDKYTYRATARGAIKLSDGTARIESDQKEINLLDEEKRFRMEADEKVKNGIDDERQAAEAAKLFKGSFYEATNKWGKPVQAFRIDPADGQRYVERYVQVNMALLRKTWAEKAMTGAKLRVIRALLGTKGTYTLEELKKPFAIPTTVFSPDYNNPLIMQAMIQNAMSGSSNLFGHQPAAQLVQKVDFDEPVPAISDSDMNAFASENPPMDETEAGLFTQEKEKEVSDVRMQYADYNDAGAFQKESGFVQETIPLGNDSPVYTCRRCGKGITKKIAEYSEKNFGTWLCIDCQKQMKG